MPEHQQETKYAPHAYDARAIGHILERPYVLVLPDMGILARHGVRVYRDGHVWAF